MTNQFNTYRIYYQTAPQYSWQSRVYLYNNGAFAGLVMFMKEGNSLPANTLLSGQPKIHFPTSSFAEVMDILRHEEPLYITLNPDNGIGTISTSNEPIGEEEND